MRQLDQLAELGVKIRLHAQLAELEFHGPLVQQSHDDPFAVDHGDHGDADIDLAPPVRSWMRPSCGKRRSAMFSRDMIFKRLMMAD